MTKLLVVITHATDDPTMAAAAFATAVGALGAGKEVAIALIGEGAYLAKEAIPKTVHGVGFPPLTEMIDKVRGKVPIYV